MNAAMEPIPDTVKLVESARQGDPKALDVLLGHVRDPLDRHIRARIGDHLRRDVDPEDVFQETVAQAIGSLALFRGTDAGAFYRWLKGIAEHVILNIARRIRRAAIVYVDRDPPSAESPPSKALRRRERMDRLQEALDGLDPDYRTAVRLVRFEGLSIKEAAQRMERTPKSVMHLLSRALRKLRDTLGETDSLTLPHDQEIRVDDREARER